jgi:serine/arginine repetitive matrix protein 2
MADLEKEAELPIEIVESEAQRRRYIDTNFQREPGQGIFVFHYEPPEDDFTEEEHRVMVYNYRDQYAKKWGKLAEILYKETGVDRTYKHCINHYYATKWGREYKGKLKGRRGGAPRKRGGAVGRGRGAIANMDRPEAAEDGPLPLTETGRPRRSAAPTFGPTSGGNETDFDPTSATITPGRARRQTDADGAQEKGRRGKTAKEKGSRKAKNMPLAAAPTGSPIKIDRKDKAPSLKMEDEFAKRPLGEALMPMSMPLPMPMQTTIIEDPMLLSEDSLMGMPLNMMDRPKTQAGARPGPSSYWSVSELGDFDKNVAHFGTDWLAIANHMGTKTHTMIKNQYLRLIEQGRADLEQVANEADARRNRGERMGPAPTPTPAPKRRYESTQTALPRQIAPTPELHKSPPLNPLALPKTTPPHSTASSRFSTIAQAPTLGKPPNPVSSFPSMPETSLASIPSFSQQQSPPAPPQRPQVQHHQSMSQHKPQHPGPRAGYFTEELSPRHENQPPSQASHQPSRLMQHGSVMREPQQQQPYRGFGHERERDGLSRHEMQQEQDAQHRFQQHNRRISQEMAHHRPFGAGIPPLAPPQRSNSIARSPEHRSLSYSHGRHLSQAQGLGQSASDQHPQQLSHLPGAQQVPNRASILTPPVKEEPRHPPSSSIPQAQPLPAQSPHVLHHSYGQPPMQSTMQSAPAQTPPMPKPAAEPRKSNLMSLLNATESEEPVRKKLSDQGPPSHSTTPQQQTPIAPPPPPQASLPPRRDPYGNPYERQSYGQQSTLPPAPTNRTIDLTNDQASGGRPGSMRDPWQPRQQQYMPNHSQSQQSTPLQSHSGLPQPLFGESRLMNHRSVFAQHNAPRHNPSPPPHTAFNNSPHLHSRTPSISGGPNQPPRHAVPNTTGPSHASNASASALVLQPNPYAQVDPPGGSAPPTGPRGMRPSPHLHTSHVPQQRDAPSRNDLSQSHNSGMSYSNPQTPNEHPQHSLRGPAGLADPYRPRDPRDLHHEFEARIQSDRDTGRELAQRADNMLREQQSNPALQRANSLHEELRFPHQQDRGYMSQRSHTPLARADQSQPPTLQHPPNSSLGTNNHSMPMPYGQRPPPEEPPHRFGFNPRDRSFTERLREDQAQQQVAMQREDYARRDESQRERDIHMRDQQMRENLIRGNMRGPPLPGSGPGPVQDQRPPAGPPHDWTSAVRHPAERHGSWQR